MRTPQTGKTGSFFDGSNYQVWLLQLMTDKINSKEYWKTDTTVVPRLVNFIENTLVENQVNSVSQSQYITHLDTLE